LTSKEARHLLFERISKDQEFYKSLRGSDKGDEDEDQEGRDVDQEAGENDNGEIVHYDEIGSSQTIHEAIAEVVAQTPANHLADIYADRRNQESEKSDSEDRGTGFNLDRYIVHPFAACDATQRWMEWDSK
jgi:hypothetical protein